MFRAGTIATLIGVLVCGGPVQADEGTNKRLDELERRIEKLEKNLQGQQDGLEFLRTLFGKGTAKEISKEKSKPKKRQPLTLVDWNASLEKGDYREYFKITYQVKNTLNKGIKLIEGSIKFRDLLGETIMVIEMNKDMRIKPGRSATYTGHYRATMFGSGDKKRLVQLPKAEVQGEVLVKKIVLSDNTIIEY